MKIYTSLKLVFFENKFFLIPYVIFFISGGILSILLPREEILILLNSNNSPFGDTFFKWATNIGDGLFYLIIILILGMFQLRLAFIGVLSYTSSGIAAQIIKYIVNSPRPKTYLGNSYILHYVEGVTIYAFNSFPSGHSASAFSLCLFLAAITANKPLGALYFIAALLIGLSRVYLAQHFFVDIWFGSFLGVIFTIAILILMQNNRVTQKLHWLDVSIVNRFLKRTNTKI